MNNVAHITPHLLDTDAPAALRDIPGWVIWRFEDNPGKKPRKMPYYAVGGKRHGEQGSPKDVASLVTFDAARRAAAKRGFDGVGFATVKEFGICALDFDNCVKNGEINPEVQAVLNDSYAEFSPSGNGVRVFFQGDLGNGKAIRNTDLEVEVFSTRGFVTYTGNTLAITELLGNHDTVAPLTSAVLALHAKRFARHTEPLDANPSGEPAGLSSSQIAQALEAMPDDLHYDDWLMVGMAIHCETRGEGFEVWDTWSAKSSKYSTREYTEDRWRSFGKGNGATVTGRSLVHLANEFGAGILLNGPASAEEFEALVDQASADTSKPPRYNFEPVHLFADSKALPWMIKGVLPKAGLAVVYGASGSGKSFAVLDMALAIAQGIEWRGKRVKQGRVAYIAAEGADGFRKRLAAYALSKGCDLSTVPMTVLNAAPNLLEKNDARDVVAGIRASGGADLIIIDTFAQTTPGANENAGEDVGKALSHCKRIHELTGAMVVLIHHSGKDASKGARGWSGLRAAADAEIEVVREATGRYLRLSKSKDGEDGLEWGFDLEVVTLGHDEDMDPITSCVVVETAVPAKGGVASRKLSKNQLVVNEVLQEIAASQTAGIEIAPVLAEAARRMMARDGVEEDRKGNYKSNARRSLHSLCDGDEAPYWLDPSTNTIEIV